LLLALGYLVLLEFLQPAGLTVAGRSIIPGRRLRAGVPAAVPVGARADVLDQPEPPMNGSSGR
jgi:hypothetical protein